MIPSPCIHVCRLDPRTGWCEGCFRTLAEIAAWSSATEAGQTAILARVAERSAPRCGDSPFSREALS